MSAMLILLTMAGMLGAPRVENARLETIRLEGTLERTLRRIAARQDEPVWIGYSVEAAEGGDWTWCCCRSRSHGWGDCDTCSLDEDSFCASGKGDGKGDTDHSLSDERRLLVLARLVEGRVDRIRTFSDDCLLDAGGRLLYWIEGVDSGESADWLSGIIDAGGERPDTVFAAMSMHAGEHAIDTLIDLAREPHPASLRRKALFWLSQRAGMKAMGVLTEALEDEETEVKKAAVFGISQLPPDEGIPILIKLAREHRNRQVRRDAIFWLGQSGDPRAFDFIVEILKG